MSSRQNNVELVVEVEPNPLRGRAGDHTFWLNNNNDWTASVGSANVRVRDPALAELDLVVNGACVRNRDCTGSVGNIGAWNASKPIITGLAPTTGATRTGEIVETTCAFGRLPIAPNMPPVRLFPLHVSTLVNH